MQKCNTCGESKQLSSFYFKQQRNCYFTKCKDCMKITAARWYQANKVKRLQQTKAWARNNRDRVRELNRLKNQKPSRKVANCTYSAIRRAKKRNTWKNLSSQEKMAIKELYKKAQKLGMHVDHIKPLAKGGEHCLSNLQLLTPEQNLKKGASYEG